MRRYFLYIAVTLTVLLGAGCTSGQKRQLIAAQKGIYAVNKALKEQRVDLAIKYSDQLTKIVPAPRKEIEVKPIKKEETKYVVLPQEYKGPVLNIGGADFNKLVVDNKDIKKQLEKEEVVSQKFEKEVKDVDRQLKEEAMKYENKKSFLGKIFGGFAIGGVGIVLVGILITVFCPALIPMLATIVGRLFGFISDLVNWLFKVIQDRWRKDG